MFTIGLEATRASKKYKTGTEWYAWHIIQGFKKIQTDNKFNIYYNKEIDGDLKNGPSNFNYKNIRWNFSKLWTHIRLGIELILHPIDKFFATNSVPIFSRGEIIVTIHDLGFYKNPELYHPLERIYQKISHILAIYKADKIITISETTKGDIIKYFPKAKNKIKVIYLGLDRKYFKLISEEDKKEIKYKYNLPSNYIIYLGRLESKKNVLNLIKAYQSLNTDWPLVLAGRPGNYGYEEIEKASKNNNNIISLGYISNKYYPKLFASASLFVFPTKFEGFGLPVIEAMACGVPVVCSNIPALKEVGDDAVLFFDPDNINDIANKVDKVIKDKELRNKLIQKGLKRSELFSWSKCAKKTLEYILK